MKIESAVSPVGPIHERTTFHCDPFNFVFDGEFESFSFYVPDDAVATVHKYANNPTKFKEWAAYFVGRAMDRKRCVSAGIRVVEGMDEPQIEVRLKFQVPWWYDEAKDSILQHERFP